jgi:catechol 2,3-dioxygenase-like lactoylglutathione lyase family enzyme
MKLTHIDVISIPVADPTVAKLFYTEKLGFEVLRDDAMGADRRWIQLGIPGAVTSISLVTWFDKMPPGSSQGMVLHTDDIERMHEALGVHGILISKIEDASWGRFATFHDPDMNGWVLMQPPQA